MDYKIVCSDLDGTLLTTKSDVSDFTISEISRIKEHLRVILVSARMPKAMRHLQKDLGILSAPIICYNGALVLQDNQELFSTFIAINNLQYLQNLALKHTIKLGLYYSDEWYVEEDSERVQKEIKYTKTTPVFRKTQLTIKDWETRNIGAHKIMMMCTKESADTVFPIIEKELGSHLHFYRSNDTLIEVAPKSVSKLSAIQLLLKKGDSLKEVIAFGDNYNDQEMLQKVGYGVAVGNAREEVKAVADYVTLNNTENGVADFIKKNLFI